MYLEDAFSGLSGKNNDSTNKKPHYDQKHSSYNKPSSNAGYKNSTPKHNDYRSNYSSPSTATALHTNTQSHKNSQSTKKFCYYCQSDDHDTQACRKLEKCSSSEVRNFLLTQQLCYCCMKKGHTTSQCYHKSKLICKRCNAKGHHTFLHEDKSPMKQREENKQIQESGKTSIVKSTISTSTPITQVIF